MENVEMYTRSGGGKGAFQGASGSVALSNKGERLDTG